MKIKKIMAGGGVVFRSSGRQDSQPNVLLIYRNGAWDLPKGKLEPFESIEECAVREVAEETGAELPTILARLSDTYHEYYDPFNNNIRTGKTTAWFAMKFENSQTFTAQTSEGITEILWVPFQQARKQVGYENLRTVLDSFFAWYSQSSHL